MEMIGDIKAAGVFFSLFRLDKSTNGRMRRRYVRREEQGWSFDSYEYFWTNPKGSQTYEN